MYICKNHFYHILIPPKNILSFRTNFVKCVNLLRPVGGHERPGRVVGVGHRRRHVSPRKVSAQTSRREPASLHILVVDTMQLVIKAPAAIRCGLTY